MTQRPRKAASPPRTQPYRPQPGDTVRCSDSPEIGLVVESDAWWDTLLLRGVDIADQVLVEWRENGQPIRRWERVNRLTRVHPDNNGTAQPEVEA